MAFSHFCDKAIQEVGVDLDGVEVTVEEAEVEEQEEEVAVVSR